MPSPRQLSSERDDWQTPPEIIDLVEQFNDGPIGLDPCGAPGNPTRAKENWYPPEHDGLAVCWNRPNRGLVFVNPPYKSISMWAKEAATSGQRSSNETMGAEIIFLCVPRTDTKWFRHIWTARALAFWHGSGERGALGKSRLQFVRPETGKAIGGNTGPSVFAYWGPRPIHFGRVFRPYAQIIFP